MEWSITAPLVRAGFLLHRVCYAGRTTTNVLPEKDALANYRRSSAGAGIDAGYGVLSQTDEVRLGYEVRYDKTSVFIGNPDLPAYSGPANVLALRWFHDGQDSATIPRRGVQSTLRGSWFLNSATSARDFPQAEFTRVCVPPVDDKAFHLFDGRFGYDI